VGTDVLVLEGSDRPHTLRTSLISNRRAPVPEPHARR
jgi:hypothetical protein